MLTAKDIILLLAKRHKNDVFVSECKTGSSQYSKTVRFDAWVMKKSWLNPCTIGYEIKVSRSDFTSDTKWQKYLDYCNEFYFVCPDGLIRKEELPKGVGLLWVSRNAKTLYRKRFAETNNIQIPDSIFRYILMSRTTIKKGSNIYYKKDPYS